MSEHHDGLGAVSVVLGTRQPSQIRRERQHLEVVRRHEPTHSSVRILVGDHREGPVAVLDELIQCARLVPVVLHFLEREARVLDAGVHRGLPHVKDPVRIRVRERREEHPVDDAEDRSVEPDPQAQRQDEG